MNFIRRNLLAKIGGCVLGLGIGMQSHVALAADVDVTDIMSKNFSISRVEDSLFEATFTLTAKQGSERVRKTAGGTKLQANGMDQMRLTRFVSPPDVSGTATLVVEHAGKDDDIWIYLPALKKVRRLVSSNKKDSFLGTDFSYVDVIGYPVANWHYSLLREENVNGEACYVISGTPKTPQVKSDSGYSKRVEWIQKSNNMTVKAEFFDEAGQLLKTGVFSDIKLVDPKAKKWQAMRLEQTNLQTGHRTVIQFDSFKVNQKVDEQMFTTRALEKQ